MAQYQLNLNIEGDGDVQLDPDKEYYESGETVYLTADPNEGLELLGYSDNVEHPNARHTYITFENDDITVTATFVQIEVYINLDILGEGNIDVFPDEEIEAFPSETETFPVQEQFYYLDDEIQLTANENRKWQFDDWEIEQIDYFDDMNIENNIITLNLDDLKLDEIRETDLNKLYYESFAGFTSKGMLHYPFNVGNNLNEIPLIYSFTVDIYASFKPRLDIKTKSYDSELKLPDNISVTTSPNNQEFYELNEEVILTAEDNYDLFEFSHWSDNVDNPQDISTTITMDNYKSVIAYYKPKGYIVNLDSIGNGTASITPDSSYYQYDDEITLTVDDYEEDWEFVGWSGDIDKPETSITVEDVKVKKHLDIKANFYPTIKTDQIEEGSVIINSTIYDDTALPYNSEANLLAVPSAGRDFIKWRGDVPDEKKTNNNINLTMDRPREVTAVFGSTVYSASITQNTSNGGNAIIVPDVDNYAYNQLVEIKATSDTGWEFDKWEGTFESSESNIELPIRQSIDLEAIFSPKLDVEVTSGKGDYNITPDKETYDLNEIVTLEAVPDTKNGYEFESWTNNVEDDRSKETTVTMSRYKSISLDFNLITYNIDTNILNGDGNVVINPNQDAYEENQEVTVTAMPDHRYSIVEWSGDIPYKKEKVIDTSSMVGSGDEKSVITFNIDDNTDININFIKEHFLYLNQTGEGNMNMEPGRYIFEEGETVSLSVKDNDIPLIKWEIKDINNNTVTEKWEQEISVDMYNSKEINVIFDPNALIFNDMLQGGEIKAAPGEIVEIDISAYFKYGDDEQIEYLIEHLPPNVELDRDNLMLEWTVLDNFYDATSIKTFSTPKSLSKTKVGSFSTTKNIVATSLRHFSTLKLYNTSSIKRFRTANSADSTTSLKEFSLPIGDIAYTETESFSTPEGHLEHTSTYDFSTVKSFSNNTEAMEFSTPYKLYKTTDIFDFSTLSLDYKETYINIFSTPKE